MRLAAGRQTAPRLLEDADSHARDRRPGHEVIREPQRERLDVIDRILARQRVHGVLHRVGGEARPVVAVDVDGLERALELHVDRQVDELVRIAGSAHLHQPDARFAVAIPGQFGHRDHTNAESTPWCPSC
jgi:hypothetical protein